MTERETKIIDEEIAAYERMIRYYEKQISSLRLKKTAPCCFGEKDKIKIKIKGG